MKVTVKHFVVPHTSRSYNRQIPICNEFATLKDFALTSDIAEVTCKTCKQILRKVLFDGVSVMDLELKKILMLRLS